VVKDNYQKIYPLAEDLYFAMTGVYEAGLEVLKAIKGYDVNDRDSFVENVGNFFDFFFRANKPEKLTILIAGRNNNRNFFIWQRNIKGDTNVVNGSKNIEYAISSNDKMKDFGEYLENQIKLGLNCKDAMIKTIEYASKINSSISKEYELHEI